MEPGRKSMSLKVWNKWNSIYCRIQKDGLKCFLYNVAAVCGTILDCSFCVRRTSSLYSYIWVMLQHWSTNTSRAIKINGWRGYINTEFNV